MTARQMAACAYSRSFFGSGCIPAIYTLMGLATTGLAADPGFEQPSPVDTRRFLPQALLESQQHRVNPEARDESSPEQLASRTPSESWRLNFTWMPTQIMKRRNLNWIASRGRKLSVRLNPGCGLLPC